MGFFILKSVWSTIVIMKIIKYNVVMDALKADVVFFVKLKPKDELKFSSTF